jgi:hypothetical protein
MTHIEIDDKPDGSGLVLFGGEPIGWVRPRGDAHAAIPRIGTVSVHPDQDAAITAVVHAHTGGGHIIQDAGPVREPYRLPDSAGGAA